jgi:hypothetical protein
MPQLDKMGGYAQALKGAQHLLLIAHTKHGKTHYAAQAAIDGYELFYVDKDNGLVTLEAALKDYPEAQRRVHYFAPESMVEFIESIYDLPIIRWNFRTNQIHEVNSAKPDDQIAEIIPARIGRNVILCLDTWTSAAYSALMWKAEKMNVDLTDMDKWGREIYGNAGFRMTNVAKRLQNLPFHIINMAHSQQYEIKEKPAGRRVEDIKERDMIIKETLEVPTSTSAPHGLSIGQYFNQIGYITLNSSDKRQIDYRLIKGRIGGGTPNAILDIATTGRWAARSGRRQ